MASQYRHTGIFTIVYFCNSFVYCHRTMLTIIICFTTLYFDAYTVLVKLNLLKSRPTVKKKVRSCL